MEDIIPEWLWSYETPLVPEGANKLIKLVDKRRCESDRVNKKKILKEIRKLLIKRPKMVNEATVCDFTAMHYAVAFNDVSCAKALLKNAEVNLNLPINWGPEVAGLLGFFSGSVLSNAKFKHVTPLVLSVIDNNQEMFELIFEHHKDTFIDLSEFDAKHEAILSLKYALLVRNKAIVHDLLSNGLAKYLNEEKIELYNLIRNISRWKSKHFEMIGWLLDEGLDLTTAEASTGSNILHECILSHNPKSLKYLISLFFPQHKTHEQLEKSPNAHLVYSQNVAHIDPILLTFNRRYFDTADSESHQMASYLFDIGYNPNREITGLGYSLLEYLVAELPMEAKNFDVVNFLGTHGARIRHRQRGNNHRSILCLVSSRAPKRSLFNYKQTSPLAIQHVVEDLLTQMKSQVDPDPTFTAEDILDHANEAIVYFVYFHINNCPPILAKRFSLKENRENIVSNQPNRVGAFIPLYKAGASLYHCVCERDFNYLIFPQVIKSYLFEKNGWNVLETGVFLSFFAETSKFPLPLLRRKHPNRLIDPDSTFGEYVKYIYFFLKNGLFESESLSFLLHSLHSPMFYLTLSSKMTAYENLIQQTSPDIVVDISRCYPGGRHFFQEVQGNCFCYFCLKNCLLSLRCALCRHQVCRTCLRNLSREKLTVPRILQVSYDTRKAVYQNTRYKPSSAFYRAGLKLHTFSKTTVGKRLAALNKLRTQYMDAFSDAGLLELDMCSKKVLEDIDLDANLCQDMLNG